MIAISEQYGPYIASAIRLMERQTGYAPRELHDLADELLTPERVAQRRTRMLSAARCRRYRKRKRARQAAAA